MPHNHDSHEKKCKNKREKPALSELVKNRREIEKFDRAKDENEQNYQPNTRLPNDDHDERNHGSSHDHDGDNGNAVGVTDVISGFERSGYDDTCYH